MVLAVKEVACTGAMFAGLVVAYTVANPVAIKRTEYTLKSDKLKRNYKIVFISDIHYGYCQDIRKIDNALGRVDSERPDIVILGGDITQVQITTKPELRRIYGELGSLSNKYGIYFIYGNHDFGRYKHSFGKACSGNNYDKHELFESITSNGISVLSDSIVDINNDLRLVGRYNKADDEVVRAKVNNLIPDTSRYNIVADHYPVEMGQCSRSGADLQLSGHTHGGQIFPGNLIVKMCGMVPYGLCCYGNMSLIVSSGMGVSCAHARNLHACEYVVINLCVE